MIADLLDSVRSDPDGYGWRLARPAAFTGQRIGYKPFVKATEGLNRLGYLNIDKGWKSLARDASSGIASCYRPTPELIAEVKGYGIDPARLFNHFGFPPPTLPKKSVVLKAASRKLGGNRGKVAGRSMRVDPAAAEVIASLHFLNAYNSFLQKFSYNFDQPLFVRVFNNGDKAGFAYNEGGRLYAQGGGFQIMPRVRRSAIQADRTGMTINGAPTAEIDIGASHYSIAMSLTGLPFNATVDPYVIEGLPRCIVKEYINICIGNGGSIRGWPADTKAEYARAGSTDKPNKIKIALEEARGTYTGNLQRDYPISMMKSKVRPRFPVLKLLKANDIDWGKLQYVESCIIVDTLDDLMKNHDVVALPVHDSLICRKSEAELVYARLSFWFERHTGLVPKLNTK